MVVPHYEDEGMLWNTMMSECENLVPADPCLAAAEFLDWHIIERSGHGICSCNKR